MNELSVAATKLPATVHNLAAQRMTDIKAQLAKNKASYAAAQAQLGAITAINSATVSAGVATSKLEIARDRKVVDELSKPAGSTKEKVTKAKP